MMTIEIKFCSSWRHACVAQGQFKKSLDETSTQIVLADNSITKISWTLISYAEDENRFEMTLHNVALIAIKISAYPDQ